MEDKRRQSPTVVLIIWLFGLYGLLLIAYLVARALPIEQPAWLALLHNAAPYFFLPAVLGVLIGLLGRAKRLFALHLILFTIGVAWVGIRVAPPPQTAAENTPLSVLTLNAYPQNEDVSDAITYILSKDADVVLLQEITDDQDWSELAAAYPEVAPDSYEDGMAIFSRVPITSNEMSALGDEALQIAELAVNGEAVALYNVHLMMPLNQQASAPLLMRYDETARNAQIEALLALLAAEERPFIVAGDFNTSEFSFAYDRLNAQLNDAYRAASFGIGATWPADDFEELAIPGWMPRIFRLDYIWYSDEIRATDAIVGPRVGSDHLPLFAMLDLDL